MRVLAWNTHGGWMNGFVRGNHDYLLPVDREGRGGRGWYPWPANVRDIREQFVADAEIDVAVVQDMAQISAVEELTGREPGRDLPTIFVEHNTPSANVPTARHPLADHSTIPIVHVTHFNALMWDNGRARVRVIEHGIHDPGYQYTGDVRASAVVINEPIRRSRTTGTDLLRALSMPMRIDLFGLDGAEVAAQLGLDPMRLMFAGNMRFPRLHRETARRRVYLHPNRWTSLGIALLEAMACGMPVVGLAATEISRAVPREAGVVSTHLGELAAAITRFANDHDAATAAGLVAREHTLAHYGIQAFKTRWDELLDDTVARAKRKRQRLPHA